MSDHEQPPSEEEQRAQRRDRLRQLAWEQTGEAPAVAPTNPATRRLSGRVALAALAICVVLAGTGVFAIVRARQPLAQTPPISPTTQTSAPACARPPSHRQRRRRRLRRPPDGGEYPREQRYLQGA